MQLAILAAVLAALAAGDPTATSPVGGVAWRLGLAVAASLVAPLAAFVGTQRLVAGLELAGQDADREARLARLQARVIGLWLAAALVVLFVAGWPQIVRSNWALAAWPLVDELAILTPILAPLVVLWAVFYRLERAAQLVVFRARKLDPPPPRLRAYLWLHVRFHLGLVVLPALVVISAQEFLAAYEIDLTSGGAALWLGIPIVAGILLLMPLAVRRIWRTTSLPHGELRNRLTTLCHERNCPVRDLLIWHTDGYVANAAVVGLSRWLRYVLLTDALLARLSADEVAAVMRHELGHLRRRHLPLRLALLALPIVWWAAIKTAWPAIDTMVSQRIEGLGLSSSLLASTLIPLAMLVYAVVVVGWYSRLLEHDADLEACLDSRGAIDAPATADFVHALTRLLGSGPESRLAQWLHPSLAQRLRFLQRAANEPQFATPFRQRLKWIAVSIAGLYLLAAVMAAYSS